MQNFSEIVKSIRIKQKFTQSEVAMLMRISIRTYQRFEANPKIYSKNFKKFILSLNLTPNTIIRKFNIDTSSKFFKDFMFIKMSHCDILFKRGMKTKIYYDLNEIDYHDYLDISYKKKIFVVIASNNNLYKSFSAGAIVHILHYKDEEKNIIHNGLYEIKEEGEIIIKRAYIDLEKSIFKLTTDNEYDEVLIFKTERELENKIRGKVLGHFSKD